MRDHIYNIIEGNSDLLISKVISWIILLAILVSSVAFVLESDPDLLKKYGDAFHLLDTIVVIIFTIEYVSRLILVRNRLKFSFQLLNIVDLLAILPFYLALFLPVHMDLRIVRLIRLVRVFRLFKLAKYSDSFTITAKAIKESGAALFALIMLMTIVLIMSSSFMYFAEHEAHLAHCPDTPVCKGLWIEGKSDPNNLSCPICAKPVKLPKGTATGAKPFRSIMTTFWWCLVTMTTVGYGDVVPQTTTGAFIAGFTMILGILCIALPTGIIATNFATLYEESKKKKGNEPKDGTKELLESIDMLLKATENVIRHSSGNLRGNTEEVYSPVFHPTKDFEKVNQKQVHCPHCFQEFNVTD